MLFGSKLLGVIAAVLSLPVGFSCSLQAQPSHVQNSPSSTPYRFKAAADHATFEWYFLLVDAGNEQGIWAKNGLAPQFVPAAGSATQLKTLIESGVNIGFVNAAEVTLARSQGVPVKTVAGYFGETTARIFVAAGGSIKIAKDLDGKKIGIIANTHTSYRTVLFMNKALSIAAIPIAVGTLESNLGALKAGRIDAFYSAEGAALTFVDSGDVRLILPLSEIYPKPYTAVVVWATEDLIEQNPDLVTRYVRATLEIVGYLKAHPDYASNVYAKRTGAPKKVADKAVASLNQILTSRGRGSGQDLTAAVAGNWKFIIESGAVAQDTRVKIDEVVDTRFLPL